MSRKEDEGCCEIKLLACPFCGEDEGSSAPQVEFVGGYPAWFRVRCLRCCCLTDYFRTEELAINCWNMRNGPKSVTFARMQGRNPPEGI